jgi:hypothetical protein
MRNQRFFHGLVTTCFIIASLIVGGCGGGSTTLAPSTPSPPPTPVSTSVAFADAGETFSLPVVDGIKSTLTLPPNNLSKTTDTFTMTVADHPFGGLPVFGHGHSYLHPILYAAITSARAVTFSGIPAFQVTIPAPVPFTIYGIASYDPMNPTADNGGWQQISWLTWAGSGTAGGVVMTLPASAIAFSLSAKTQYGLTLFVCGNCF